MQVHRADNQAEDIRRDKASLRGAKRDDADDNAIDGAQCPTFPAPASE